MNQKKRVNMNTWDKRNKYLEENYITYEEYLNTSHWQDLRKRKLESNSKYKCHGRNSRHNLELHHKTYKRIGHEWLNDVIWLCRNCHKEVHNYEIEHRGNFRNNLWTATKKITRRHKCPNNKISSSSTKVI